MSAMDAAWSTVDGVWPYLVLIGTVVLFVVGCRVLLRLADRHRDAEPRGPLKAAIAIVASLLLGLGGLAVLGGLGVVGVQGFEQHAREGMHDTLLKNLNRTIGEADYQEAVKVTINKPGALALQRTKLEQQNATLAGLATLDPDHAGALKNRTETWAAANQTVKDIADAHTNIRKWTPNHLVWLQVEPLIRADRDDEAEAIIQKAANKDTITQLTFLPPLGDIGSPCTRTVDGYCRTPPAVTELQHTYLDLHGHAVAFADDGPQVFENQREFNHQMATQMRWFVYPGVTGLFLAPFAFAGGHILGKAYESSSGVGYKRYPGKAAGLFLLCMAGFSVLIAASTLSMGIPRIWNLPPMLDIFGILAIPFGAWVLRDLHKRSTEGQIAL